MLTFLYRLVEIPRACCRTVAVLAAGLLVFCTPASGQKTSPTVSQSATPAAANSPVKAASENVIGRVIEFTADSERYRVSGWNKSEGKYAWTEGTSARLAYHIPADAGSLNLKMTLRGLVKPPALPFQPVEVYANDKKIADWQVSDTAAFTAEIPAELTKSGGQTLNLQLRIPKATSPKSLGMNTDERILGVSCYSIELTQR